MTYCTHDLTEREVACADGMCPMCLAARVRELEAERDQANDAVRRLTDGQPFEAVVAAHTIANMTDALRAENERLRGQLDQAIARIKDMLMGDDGQAWKEARKFLDSIDAALKEKQC